MIQVFLVDDHPVVRAGIRYLLQGKVEIVGEAETGQEALLKIPQARPQVVILDIASKLALMHPGDSYARGTT
ncbi:hypothetical protein TthAK1_15620 [Thermus thermophilus]|uniref:response regulator transcription factor n=1 Tax=Thermus thermophilus TaxID=274 RepID=UPI001C79A27E|nr:response regulator [Thermus thermophilus]BCZ94945.1 hypothetical protein TthAK1_15620 [Thermus thermophilus]